VRICIAGVGAIGTYLAARLTKAGADLCLLRRPGAGTSLEPCEIRLVETDKSQFRATLPIINPGTDDPPDWIFVCTKAYDIPGIAGSLRSLVGPATEVVFVQNGLPWWMAASPGRLDPDGALTRLLPRSRVVGAVAYANVRRTGAGEAAHAGDDRLVLGRPAGALPGALTQLVEAMRRGGIDARASEHIEAEVWGKLWGSLAFNPISALTGATLDRIVTEPDTRPLVLAMMAEGAAVAGATGIMFPLTPAARLDVAARAGAFKTSMLQDLEAGRRLESDAILGAVSDAGRDAGIATPLIDAVHGLLRQRAATLGLA